LPVGHGVRPGQGRPRIGHGADRVVIAALPGTPREPPSPSDTIPSCTTAFGRARGAPRSPRAGFRPVPAGPYRTAATALKARTGTFAPRITLSATLPRIAREMPDRKSTRLNSSHVKISYAVFCLKKKKREARHTATAPDQAA